MKHLLTEEIVVIPKDVKISVKSRVVTISGLKGKIIKSFKHITCDMRIEERNGETVLVISLWFGKYKLCATIRTISSHIRNMIRGVQKGHKYKMRMVHAHFPINISITNMGQTIEIRNFIGEKHVKKINLLPGCVVKKVETPKDQIEIEGVDLENVSLSCALISQCVKCRHKDIRKFLDGIYVSEKTCIDEAI